MEKVQCDGFALVCCQTIQQFAPYCQKIRPGVRTGCPCHKVVKWAWPSCIMQHAMSVCPVFGFTQVACDTRYHNVCTLQMVSCRPCCQDLLCIASKGNQRSAISQMCKVNVGKNTKSTQHSTAQHDTTQHNTTEGCWHWDRLGSDRKTQRTARCPATRAPYGVFENQIVSCFHNVLQHTLGRAARIHQDMLSPQIPCVFVYVYDVDQTIADCFQNQHLGCLHADVASPGTALQGGKRFGIWIQAAASIVPDGSLPKISRPADF